jgi:3-oxoacyl-[acyl-carrier-protein] synthase-3
MFQKFEGVEILAISACVPKNIINNSFFGDLLTDKEKRIFEKTVGIYERRWAEPGVTASDLGYEAALNLIKNYNVNDSEIDCLIFLSQTSDYKIPFTSNILQARLGLKQQMLCLDINAGCAGFVQGLSTCFAIAKSLKKRKILFIVAETLSKILSLKDRSTTMIFGDGASAILIEYTGNDNAESFFNFNSDGIHADAISIPDGGYRNEFSTKSLCEKADEKFNIKNRLNLIMDGPRVFDFTLREIAPSIEAILSEYNHNKDQIDAFLFHQSNQFIIKQIGSTLGVPAEKLFININKYGNTSGVSIPLLICSNSKKFISDSFVCLSGYGSGLNWGNGILKLNSTKIFSIKEV